MQFAQISDCHIGKKDNNKNLKTIVKKLKELGIKIIVVSGDITENGLFSEYLKFQYIMRDFEVFTIAGNHDNLSNIHKVFSTKHTNNFQLNGFNIQLINSKVENQVFGNIDTTQIDPNLKNSILITHHPIVKMQSDWDDNLSCENMFEVMEFIQNHNNVKAVCFGHTHAAKDFVKNHIQIYSCPSTAYQFDSNQKIGFNLFELDKEIKKTTIWV
jgi:Icc protein